jgi:hypothetical protein
VCLEARWIAAPERIAEIERKLRRLEAEIEAKPDVDTAALMRLARDLPLVRNATAPTPVPGSGA